MGKVLRFRGPPKGDPVVQKGPKDKGRLTVLVDIILVLAALAWILYVAVGVVTGEGSSPETTAVSAVVIFALLYVSSRYPPATPER